MQEHYAKLEETIPVMLDVDMKRRTPVKLGFSKQSYIESIQISGLVSFKFQIEQTRCVLQVKKENDRHVINVFHLLRVGLELEKECAWSIIREIAKKSSKEAFLPPQDLFEYIQNDQCTLEKSVRSRLKVLLKHKKHIMFLTKYSDKVYNTYIKNQYLVAKINQAIHGASILDESNELTRDICRKLHAWIEEIKEKCLHPEKVTDLQQLD